MREDLVSKKTAILAKEKGFNIRCDLFYCEKYGLCEEDEEVLYLYEHPVTVGTHTIYDVNNEFDEGERFYAPRQGLLQKWFREVHDIEIHISCVTQHNEVKKTCKLVHYQYFVKSKSQYYSIRIENEGFKTYELALDDALLESLKLIK